MKRIITILIVLTFSAIGFAQPGGKMVQERIKAQKVAFITERLDLTAEEAQKFWPIYNAFEDKSQQIKQNDLKSIRKSIRQNSLSDNEAQDLIDRFMAAEDKLHQAKKKLVKDLRNAIPPQKILKLKAAEDAFNRMLMDKLKERRQNRMKRNN